MRQNSVWASLPVTTFQASNWANILTQPIPESEGGVGRMCSFGQGVSLTPLQLGALVAAIANGGTLYYLQHPTTPEEIANFQPKVKRTLDIAKYIPEVEDGMAGAVEYGTARSLRVNFRELPVFGKTGTCSDNGTRFGWFASYSDSPEGSLVTVFLLEGGRPTFGPRAAELTGEFYKNLWDHDYFAAKNQTARNTGDGSEAERGRTGICVAEPGGRIAVSARLRMTNANEAACGRLFCGLKVWKMGRHAAAGGTSGETLF